MLDEKKRIDLERDKLKGYLNQGGQLEETGQVFSEKVAGIDYPADDATMGFMK
jgi:hypothetical protein